jgi:Flp pilus assembly pilin Flp
MLRTINKIRRTNNGQTALEYALIAGVVAIALIGTVKALIVPMFDPDKGEAGKAIKAGIMQAAGGAQE